MIIVGMSCLLSFMAFALGNLTERFRNGVIAGIVSFIIFMSIGATFENVNKQKYISSFNAAKTTYSDFMDNEDISPIERAQILNKIIETNQMLAEEQVEVSQWYSFIITNENKQSVISLTPIRTD